MSSEIAADFKTVPCNEYCQRIADGTHDSPKETEHGRRLVTSKNVKNGRLVLDSAYLISEADFNEINRRSKVDRWDLLLTMIGTVGEVCVVEQAEPDFAIKNVGLLKCGAEHRAKWLYYFLRSPQGQGLIEQRKKGSTQQYISLTEIRNLPISYPGDEAELRGMVSALSMLDDRITLLRETNATLEAIAQALFKSWFVDFDPVRAKMAGRAPEGMDEATAALFPDALEETELGVVPKGWRVTSIGETVSVVDYVANGSFAALKENVTLRDAPDYALYLRTTDFNSGFAGEFKYVDKAAYEFLSKSSLNGTEVVISNVGDVGTVFRPPTWLGLRMTLGSNAVALKASGQSSFIYFYFRSDKGQHDIQSIVTGSAQLKFNKTNFRSLSIALPEITVLKRFEEIAGTLLSKIDNNMAAVQTLSALRDNLIPRLISGQLRLPDIACESVTN